MKRKIIFSLRIIVPLALFISLSPVINKSNTMFIQYNGQISTAADSITPGSTANLWRINIVTLKYGHKATLTKIIDDIEKNRSQIEKNSYENNLKLFKMVSHCVGKIGNIDMKTHYFRNRLNQCPKTLNELLLQNEKLPEGRQWKLTSVGGSLYHMQGPDGIYNLKFVSSDGFCEAVYNKSGNLLTEKNDPVNMGTFNYSAGIHQKDAHRKYDVAPYLLWGNTHDSPQKGHIAIQRGITAAEVLYKKNSSEVSNYREKVLAVILKKQRIPVSKA